MGAWTEIVDYTVPSTTGEVVINNFGTITKNDFIKIIATIDNQTANDTVSLYPNGQTNGLNYHTQEIQASGGTVSAQRLNNSTFSPRFARMSNFKTAYITSFVKLSENNTFNIFANNFAEIDSNVRLVFGYSTSSGVTFPNGITSFNFKTGSGNVLGTGSRIQIYRLDAEKVADITTTANATQVDISNLSIGKDSEYLLVSDAVAAVATTFQLYANDDTNNDNYYVQFIRGDGSSATAGRVNRPIVTSTQLNETSLFYTHIKLSEIGAFTYQNYEIENVGKTNMRLTNWFASNTAENITSITKLTIGANATNGIGSGSRFILYKLK
jgi:hypothetical protein